MYGQTTLLLYCLGLLFIPLRGWTQTQVEYSNSQPLTTGHLWVIPDSLTEPQAGSLPQLETGALQINLHDTLPGDIRKPPLKKLTTFGYLRILGYGRNMIEPYPNLAPFEKAYGIGDGYREPMLSLNVTARPNGKTTFGTELYFFNPYNGGGPADNVFQMNLGINLYGNFRTKFGKFGIRTGGIHWYTLSSFTMGNFQVLDRYSIYERTPWEGVTHTEKYESYYETGAISRGDARWNNRAFQGFILDGGSLPGGLSFAFMYGKTQPNAGLTGNQTNPLATIFNPITAGNVPTYQGFWGDQRVLPSLTAGGRIEKRFNASNRISYNTLHSWTYLDSISDEQRAYQVHTLAYDLNVADIRISGEIGAGKFETPDFESDWGEALMIKIDAPKKYTFLPMSLQLYQIGSNYYNENGEILTFSNPKIQGAVIGQNIGQGSAGGALTLVGQLAHNRRGANFNTEAKVGPLSVNVGLGVAKELEALSTEISYDHRINGLALTRIYNPFPAGATGPTIVGPYGRKTMYFRGAFEIVKTTDVDPATNTARFRKVFNTVDVQAKYKVSIPKHDLYFFYIGSFQSARRELGLIPTFQEDTYVFAQYHELDVYFELFSNFILTGYGGLELIEGGINTEFGPTTNLPRNQRGFALGGGFDWTINEKTGLYFRHRLMDFEDKNFVLDHFRGRETTIELKIYF